MTVINPSFSLSVVCRSFVTSALAWEHKCSSLPALAHVVSSPAVTLQESQGRTAFFEMRIGNHYDNDNNNIELKRVSSVHWKNLLSLSIYFHCSGTNLPIRAFIFWSTFFKLPVLWAWIGITNAQNCKVNESWGFLAVPRAKWFDPGKQALDWALYCGSSSAIDSLHGRQRGIFFPLLQTVNRDKMHFIS